MSVVVSLSWRRRFCDIDGGVEGAEARAGLVGSEEGPGMVKDCGGSASMAVIAQSDVGLMVRRKEGWRSVDMKWRGGKGEARRAGDDEDLYIERIERNCRGEESVRLERSAEVSSPDTVKISASGSPTRLAPVTPPFPRPPFRPTDPI
jgi:hypothetical protein